MPPSPDHVRRTAEAYLDRHPRERDGLAPLFATLAGAGDPTHRNTFPAHVTCSAIVVNENNKVLHIQHNQTGKALAPGGHNEQSDPDLASAALRELAEETGLPPEAVSPIPGFEAVPLDIDVHDIEANPAMGEPAHQHIDFRFPFHLITEHPVALQAEEVSGYEWRTFNTVASPTVRAKLALLPRTTHP
ncbi:NUDIX hydrolase [Streptomyces sp. NPDC059037]|uniref:NUDIX hydrolase n=1 Tax=Streptomyces sp. NPDC059037 TaxID=3346710 RepID=UPI0036CD2F02